MTQLGSFILIFSHLDPSYFSLNWYVLDQFGLNMWNLKHKEL